MTIIPVDMDIARTTIQYRKKRKIKVPDAIILSTAKSLCADLLTDNIRDFQNIDNSVKIVTRADINET